MTSRDMVTGLPMELYDRAWIMGLTQHQLNSLGVSSMKFAWMEVAVI